MPSSDSQPASGRSTPKVLVYSMLAGALVAQQVGSKAVRDALFFAQISAELLPRAMILGALLSAPMVLLASLSLTRWGPRRVAAGMLALSGSLFVLEWFLLYRQPALAAWLAYLHVASLGSTTISAFFSNVAERFDPHAARRASGQIVSGAAIGGALGGLLVSALARQVGAGSLLLGLSLLNLLAGLTLARMHAGEPAHKPEPVALPFARLAGSAYLRSIAYLVALTGFTGALLDYNFKTQAALELGHGAELLQLFAMFHTGTAILTALIQVGFARTALEHLGLAGTLAVLPTSLLLGGALRPFLPRLWSALLLRGSSSVFESSLFRSAYEPLYTPLSERARRATKIMIDVAAGRLGEALGSGALLVLVRFGSDLPLTPALSLAMLGAACALLLSLKMHGGYVAELAASLRKGAVRLQHGQVVDSTTRHTLSLTHAEIDRAELMAELAAHRASLAPPPPTPRAAAGLAVSSAPVYGPLMAAIADLLSAERERVLRVLGSGTLDTRLLPFVIRLLAHTDLVEPVTTALSTQSQHAVGQLLDVLHDPSEPLVVRRRLPRILQSVRSASAATRPVGGTAGPRASIARTRGARVVRDGGGTTPARVRDARSL